MKSDEKHRARTPAGASIHFNGQPQRANNRKRAKKAGQALAGMLGAGFVLGSSTEAKAQTNYVSDVMGVYAYVDVLGRTSNRFAIIGHNTADTSHDGYIEYYDVPFDNNYGHKAYVYSVLLPDGIKLRGNMMSYSSIAPFNLEAGVSNTNTIPLNGKASLEFVWTPGGTDWMKMIESPRVPVARIVLQGNVFTYGTNVTLFKNLEENITPQNKTNVYYMGDITLPPLTGPTKFADITISTVPYNYWSDSTRRREPKVIELSRGFYPELSYLVDTNSVVGARIDNISGQWVVSPNKGVFDQWVTFNYYPMYNGKVLANMQGNVWVEDREGVLPVGYDGEFGAHKRNPTTVDLGPDGARFVEENEYDAEQTIVLVSGRAGGLSFDGYNVTYNPDVHQKSTNETFVVKIRDALGNESKDLNWRVRAVNRSPFFAEIPQVNMLEWTSAQLPRLEDYAFDPDEDPLTFVKLKDFSWFLDVFSGMMSAPYSIEVQQVGPKGPENKASNEFEWAGSLARAHKDPLKMSRKLLVLERLLTGFIIIEFLITEQTRACMHWWTMRGLFLKLESWLLILNIIMFLQH